jgi:hypothetical protein
VVYKDEMHINRRSIKLHADSHWSHSRSICPRSTPRTATRLVIVSGICHRVAALVVNCLMDDGGGNLRRPQANFHESVAQCAQTSQLHKDDAKGKRFRKTAKRKATLSKSITIWLTPRQFWLRFDGVSRKE